MRKVRKKMGRKCTLDTTLLSNKPIKDRNILWQLQICLDKRETMESNTNSLLVHSFEYQQAICVQEADSAIICHSPAGSWGALPSKLNSFPWTAGHPTEIST